LTEGRENRDMGPVAPQSGVPPNLQVGETCIIMRFLRCIFHGTGNSARLCQNFGIISGGLNPPNPPSGYASAAMVTIIGRKRTSVNSQKHYLKPMFLKLVMIITNNSFNIPLAINFMKVMPV
jgi:hypothetical protein